MTDIEKALAQDAYFNEVVAPQIPRQEQSRAKYHFLTEFPPPVPIDQAYSGAINEPSASYTDTLKAMPGLIMTGAGQTVGGVERMAGETSLSEIERAIDPLAGPRQKLREAILGPQDSMNAPISPTLAEEGRALQTGANIHAQEITPQGQNVIQDAMTSMAQSAPMYAGSILAGAATKNPAVAIGLMGSGVGAQSYGEARDAGKSRDESLRYGSIQGLIEAGGEILPVKAVLKPGAPLFKRLVQAIMTEGGSEGVTEVAQGLHSFIEGMDDSATVGDFLRKLPRNVTVAMLAGGAMGAGGAVIAHPFVRADGETNTAQPESSSRQNDVVAKLDAAMAREEARTRQGAQPQKEVGGFTDTLSNVKIADLEQQEAKKAEPANLVKSPELERRHDPLRVKPIDEMNLQEAREALRTSELTGLLSKRAYLEDMGISRLEGEEVNKEPGGVVVAVDADSMKYLNDNFGHSFGDQYLRMIGSAMREGKGNGRAYHLSGDEFAMRFDTEADANAAIESVQNNIRGRILEASHENGQTVRLEGVTLSVATGKSHGEADARLNEIKQRRTASGERAGRGEKPAWASVRQNESGRTGHDRPAGGTAQKGGGRGQPDSVPPVGEEGGVARQQEGSPKPLPPFTEGVPKTPPPPAVSNPETPAPAAPVPTPSPKAKPAPRLNRSALMKVESRKYGSEATARKAAKDMMFNYGYTAQDIHVGQTKAGKWYVYPTEKAVKEAPPDWKLLDNTYNSVSLAHNAAKRGMGLEKGDYQITGNAKEKNIRIELTEQGRRKRGMKAQEAKLDQSSKWLLEKGLQADPEIDASETISLAERMAKIEGRDKIEAQDMASAIGLRGNYNKYVAAKAKDYVDNHGNKALSILERDVKNAGYTPKPGRLAEESWLDEVFGIERNYTQDVRNEISKLLKGEIKLSSEDSVPENEPETSSPAPLPATPKKHEDVGEKIGGARKDIWAGRGLQLSDLEGNPYPTGAERTAINEAFDRFFQELKHKTDESTGATMLYSLEDSPGQGITRGQAEEAVDRFLGEYSGADSIDIRIVETPDEVPGGAPWNAGGLVNPETGEVYLVRSNLEDVNHAMDTLVHEVIGHYGIRSMLGEKRFKALITNAQAFSREELKAVARTYGLDLKNEAERAIAVEELIAHMAEVNPRAKLIDKAVAAVREFLRRLGMDLHYTREDIVAMLASARQKMKEGKAGRTEEGPFGPIFKQFKGKPKEAIEHLMKVKDGEAPGALQHPDVGSIDLVWGEEGTATKKYKDGYGLSKIVKKHPEVIQDLPNIVSNAEVMEKKFNHIVLQTEDHKAVIKLDWFGEKKVWLLTAFEKEALSSPGRTIDVADDSLTETTPTVEGKADNNITPDADSVNQTETPEFKKWFGDSWATEPATENGKKVLKSFNNGGIPRILYHGTRGDFDIYNPKKKGSSTGAPDAKLGFFFTSDRDFAASFAGEYYISKDYEGKKIEEGPVPPHYLSGGNVMPAYLKIRNPEFYFGGAYKSQELKSIIEEAKRDKKDGVILFGYKDITGGTFTRNKTQDMYIVFSPTQIKSATGNRGTFDPKNPDIRYKIKGATDQFVTDPTKEGWNLSALEIAGGVLESMKPIRRWEVNYIDVNGEEARMVVDTQAQAKREAARLKKDGANEIVTAQIETSSWLRKIAASPEYMVEKPMREAVRVSSERTDRAAEIFNENNTIDGERVHQHLADLKNGSPDDYDTLTGLLNWADRMKWGNKSAADRMKTTERLAREVGLGDDVISMWKKVRQGYDKDLDMLIKELTDLKTQSENAGIPAEVLTGRGRNDAGEEIEISLSDAIRALGEERGSYVPRLREGDYYLRGTDRKGRYWRWHGSKREMTLAKKDLTQRGWKLGEVTQVEKLPEAIYQDTKTASLAKAISQAAKTAKMRGQLPEAELQAVKNAVTEAMGDLIKARGYLRHTIRRGEGGVVLGYEMDPLDAYLRYKGNVAAGLAKTEASREFYDILKKIDSTKEPETYTMVSEYIREQLRNQETADRLVSFGKMMAVWKYLWLNPKSAAVNMTALVTTAPPAIHEYAGGGKGSVAAINGTIAKAVLDYGRSRKSMAHLTKGEQAMLEEMTRKNWDDPQLAREARAELSGRMGKAWTKAMDMGMWPFAFTERINRGATMLAAYRVAKRAFPEASHEALVKRAKHATDRAHGVYGKATQPLWAQGTGGLKRGFQAALTFTKFGHNYLQMLHELGFEKKNARAFMYALLSPGVLAGAKATPLVTAGLLAADLIAKALGDDRDQEKRFFDWAGAALGEEGEKNVRYGLAGAGLGINISGSLEPNFGFLSPSRPTEVLGAVGGVVNDFSYGWDRMAAGDYLGAAVKLAPAGPGSLVKALRERDGVKSGKGRPVYDDRGRPLTLATEDLLRLAAGFQPTERSYYTERNWEGRRESGNFASRKSGLYERLRFAYTSGNRGRIDELMEEVRDYNERARAAQEPMITMEGIRRAMRSMNRPTKRQVAVYQ